MSPYVFGIQDSFRTVSKDPGEDDTVLICLDCHNQVSRTGDLNKRIFQSHSSGGWEVQLRDAPELFPGESTSPACGLLDFCL